MTNYFKRYYLLFYVFLSPSALADVPFLDTGELLKDWQYEPAIHLQILNYEKSTTSTKAGNYINMFAMWDGGFMQREDVNVKYFAAGGSSGALGGAFLKWIPFPDYRYQPAMGFSIGGGYQFEKLSSHHLKLYIRPLISKRFIIVDAQLIPYISIPLGMHIKNFTSFKFPINLTFGFKGELFFISFREFYLILEYSLALVQSTSSYISVGVSTQLSRSNF